MGIPPVRCNQRSLPPSVATARGRSTLSGERYDCAAEEYSPHRRSSVMSTSSRLGAGRKSVIFSNPDVTACAAAPGMGAFATHARSIVARVGTKRTTAIPL